jgi:glyoxylase-like metal-dependent hydrolase (beta-lactamase superfamily II)
MERHGIGATPVPTSRLLYAARMERVQVSPSVHACLQPDLGLGYSNSGLVDVGGGLVVDTFWDLPRTAEMKHLYEEVLDDAPRRLVNTHHNGDHCWGNQLFADAGTEIIGHRLCVEYFEREASPELFVRLCNTPDDQLGSLAGFVHGLRRFDFEGIDLTPPTTVVDGDTVLDLDGTEVQLLYVGPAHTAGDLVVFLPAEGVLFTGDVLFNQCTPIGWQGTFANWITALVRLEALQPAVVVPGHGPLTDGDGLRGLRGYLEYVHAEARDRFERGLSTLEAARSIELGPYAGWTEPERLAFQVDRAYRELSGGSWDQPVDTTKVFAEVAALRDHLSTGEL